MGGGGQPKQYQALDFRQTYFFLKISQDHKTYIEQVWSICQ